MLRQKFPFLRYWFCAGLSAAGTSYGRDRWVTGGGGDGRVRDCQRTGGRCRRRDRRDRQVRLRQVDPDECRRRGGSCSTPPSSARIRSSPWNSVPMRIQRAADRPSAPGAKVFSIEKSGANASVARRVWAHAGSPIASPASSAPSATGRRSRFSPRSTDSPRLFGFRIPRPLEGRVPRRPAAARRPGLAASGNVVVADNVGFPGAPNTAPT